MSNTPAQQPGWYYAQGDPPGTQRYWDGSAWQGGPQPVAAEGATMAGGANAAPGERFVAFLIDAGIMFGALIVGGILIAIFGAIALTLASVGLYSVLSYVVRLRQNELGVRMAFGATPWRIFRLVVGRGMGLAVVGAAIGVAVSVEVTPVALQAVEQMSAQHHQHRPDGDLEPAGQCRAHGAFG